VYSFPPSSPPSHTGREALTTFEFACLVHALRFLSSLVILLAVGGSTRGGGEDKHVARSYVAYFFKDYGGWFKGRRSTVTPFSGRGYKASGLEVVTTV